MTKKQTISILAAAVILIGGIVFLVAKKHNANLSQATNMASSTEIVATMTPEPKASVKPAPSSGGDVNVVAEGIGILSPKDSVVFGGNDTIPVQIRGLHINGPIYVFLYNPNTMTYLATQAFEKGEFQSTGDSNLPFNLEKNKAPSEIADGVYKLIVCDHGTVPMDKVCAYADITIHN